MKTGLTQAAKKSVLFIKQERCYKTKPTRILINWGSSNHNISYTDSKVYNSPYAIQLASNKIYTLTHFTHNNVPCPAWTTDKNTALGWIEANKTVVCRKTVTSHSGNGIVFAETAEDLENINAPLYTMYIKKRKEFRVHVFNNKVIDVQEKRRNTDVQNVDYRIRNHDNGFVFCRTDVNIPDNLHNVALQAVSALGLDFGAVDIVWNENENACYALEVNTAPGLEGSTLDAYTKAIMEVVYE